MPGATMEHEDPWKFPVDEPLPAALSAVTERTRTKRNGEEFTRWDWEFSITEGQYAGLRAWGDTEDSLTDLPGNKVRQWAEALRGNKPFEFGESFHTDDLIGLPCLITVNHETYTRADGSEGYKEPVRDVFSADLASEPPF